MNEARRRSLDRVSRRLKSCETQLETARAEFAKELEGAVDDDGDSLGDVSRVLKQLGRDISRQRVHQIIKERRELDGN